MARRAVQPGSVAASVAAPANGAGAAILGGRDCRAREDPQDDETTEHSTGATAGGVRTDAVALASGAGPHGAVGYYARTC